MTSITKQKEGSEIGILKELRWSSPCHKCKRDWLTWSMIIAPDQVWIFKKQITYWSLKGY